MVLGTSQVAPGKKKKGGGKKKGLLHIGLTGGKERMHGKSEKKKKKKGKTTCGAPMFCVETVLNMPNQ